MRLFKLFNGKYFIPRIDTKFFFIFTQDILFFIFKYVIGTYCNGKYLATQIPDI